MVESPSIFREIQGLLKRFGRDLLGLGQVRLELFVVEIQEERERWIAAFFLSLLVAAFGLLAGFSLTIAVAVLLWEHSPGYALLILTSVYSLAAFLYYRRLAKMRREWSILPETLGQLQKDRECLERLLK
ncbi:MAG: phage holin family protein [Verrucomicrobiales bacterium]|nr:phage holin family protein [Verrucomicrobiales bacterium]